MYRVNERQRAMLNETHTHTERYLQREIKQDLERCTERRGERYVGGRSEE